jgi:hypothetical protein
VIGEGLDQDFNSLDAQRESAEAYIRSQAHEGWKLVPTRGQGRTETRSILHSVLDFRLKRINSR